MGLQECKKIYDKLDPQLKEKAVNFLNKTFSEFEKNTFREWIKKDPEDWFAKSRWHFEEGMKIRNLLRENRFGEKYFCIQNLDDIYVELIEDAIKI